MPELPEVETTLCGIQPWIQGKHVTNVVVRYPHLRWPIPPHLKKFINGHILKMVTRRAKYLLFEFEHGTMILHLGMSGRLRVLSVPVLPQKHDHVDICFNNNTYLRFTDPRRFGALLWTNDHPDQHPLLKNIGPEPLSSEFNKTYLLEKTYNKKISIKALIMNSAVVAGVGNIYATEALFAACILPTKPAHKISVIESEQLVKAIKQVLKRAIKKGGTTLKDFAKPSGAPGYFSIELKVYGREGKPCSHCGTLLKTIRITERSTVYCPNCQN